MAESEFRIFDNLSLKVCHSLVGMPCLHCGSQASWVLGMKMVSHRLLLFPTSPAYVWIMLGGWAGLYCAVPFWTGADNFNIKFSMRPTFECCKSFQTQRVQFRNHREFLKFCYWSSSLDWTLVAIAPYASSSSSCSYTHHAWCFSFVEHFINCWLPVATSKPHISRAFLDSKLTQHLPARKMDGIQIEVEWEECRFFGSASSNEIYAVSVFDKTKQQQRK